MTHCLKWLLFGTFSLGILGLVLFSRFERHDSKPNINATQIASPPAVIGAELEAKYADTKVRMGPAIDTAQLGLIQPSKRYKISGTRFDWYQIEHSDTPLGVAWVNSFVVNVTGDTRLIPEVIPMLVPTITPIP